jgi:phosphoglycolate phosphatase-like HAD superfamily hydrolase
MLKAIIFDFDGVIVESVAVKTDAFRRLFAQYPEHHDEILTYHKINGGISRYVKFQYIYDKILKQPLSEAQSKQLGERFTQYALEEVLAAPFVDGAEAFLKKYHDRLKLFIVSGTPQDEMCLITHKRELDQYFKGVYGSPRSKRELSQLILKDHLLAAQDVIFVGDSINDYDGAVGAGVTFVGRLHPIEPNPFRNANVKKIINNISDLERLLIQEKRL